MMMIKLILKLILFIILLPFILVWLLARFLRYKAVLRRNLTEAGMPGDLAAELVKEAGIAKAIKGMRLSAMNNKVRF